MPKSRSSPAPYVAAAGLALGLWAWAVVLAARTGCSPQAPPAAEFPRARIDVNAADEGTLRALPGVGRVLARRIVAERRSGGPFRKAEDLMRVRGFTRELVGRIGGSVEFGGVRIGGNDNVEGRP